MTKPEATKPGKGLHSEAEGEHGDGLAKMFKDMEDDAPETDHKPPVEETPSKG